jgi:hypothetical protein
MKDIKGEKSKLNFIYNVVIVFVVVDVKPLSRLDAPDEGLVEVDHRSIQLPKEEDPTRSTDSGHCRQG